MMIQPVSNQLARQFLDHHHPLRCRGSLRGQKHIFAGYENNLPTFIAVFVSPRSRWRNHNVTLELSRLAWSPTAKHSASTFLRQCIRILRPTYTGLIVTYALPNTEGIVYTRAGFYPAGYSDGAAWSKRGPGERATPNTIGTNRKLKRFFASLERRTS